MSPQWCEDLSSSTLEEIIQLESDNRAWRKELKIKVDSLIDDKLAKRIGAEQYAAGRRATGEESAECSRRWLILNEKIATRRHLRRASADKNKLRP